MVFNTYSYYALYAHVVIIGVMVRSERLSSLSPNHLTYMYRQLKF